MVTVPQRIVHVSYNQNKFTPSHFDVSELEEARIVGGKDVEVGDWPFTAAIYRSTPCFLGEF